MTKLWIFIILAIIFIAVKALTRKGKKEITEPDKPNSFPSNKGKNKGKAYYKGKAYLPDDVVEAIDKGRKLDAVKLYRKHTGCTLAEAQAVIDANS